MLERINNTNSLKGIWIHLIKADPDIGCISVCWFNGHLLKILSYTNHTTQRQPSDQCAACSVLTLQFSDWNLKYGHSMKSRCIGGQSDIKIDCYNFIGKSQLYSGHITVSTSGGVDINKKCCYTQLSFTRYLLLLGLFSENPRFGCDVMIIPADQQLFVKPSDLQTSSSSGTRFKAALTPFIPHSHALCAFRLGIIREKK